MDKMMAYVNAHPQLGVNLMYSTPSRYLAAVNALNLSWSVKDDDFFPYSQVSVCVCMLACDYMYVCV